MTHDPNVFEHQDSRATRFGRYGSQDRSRLQFIVDGVDDEKEAIAKLNAIVPDTTEIGDKVKVFDGADLRQVGPRTFHASIDYEEPTNSLGGGAVHSPSAVGESTFEFDTQGGTTTITQAIQQEKYGNDPIDYGNSINVVEGKPQGVEVYQSTLRLSIHQRFDGGTINIPWVRSIAYLTTTTNLTPFLGFDAGELLFLGSRGRQPRHYASNGVVVPGERTMSFDFLFAPNLTLNIDGHEFDAKGHEVVWIDWSTWVSNSGQEFSQARGIYVAVVYKQAEFRRFGIVHPDINFPLPR
ncbi:MAG: hypothetical protein AAFP69_22700 [Planctomycetota bacterium]